MSLKNLIALQAQKRASESNTPAVNTTPNLSPPVEAESQKDDTGATTPASAKPKGLGLNTAGRAVAKPAPKPVESPTLGIEEGAFSLQDLAALDSSSIEEAKPEVEGSGYEDEIEATAPERALAPDLIPEQLAFVESLDGIYQVLHDPEMFGQAVRMVMIELQENPEYDKLLADEDVHVMIRGMRRTMGLARVKKQEKKRTTTTKTNARKKSGVSDDHMELLAKLMGGATE